MTYSVAITGALADNKNFVPLTLTMDDAYARPGGQQLAASTNTGFLCRNPDGSQSYYTLDAERSDPARNLRYFLKV